MQGETNPFRAIVDYCKYTECNQFYHVKHVKSPNLYGIHYVVKCSDIYYDDGQIRQKLKEGCLYFFPANIEFELRYRTESMENHYHIYWVGFISKPGLCDCVMEYAVQSLPNINALMPLFKALTADHLLPNQDVSSYIINNFVSTLMILLDNEQPFKTLENTQLEKVVFHIHQNLNGDLSSEKLAEIAMLNRSYFYALFHAQMKLTPHQYVTEMRLLKAKELLKSNVKVTEIANVVGFSDEKTFSRAFHNHTGCSPMAFKKQIKTSYY